MIHEELERGERSNVRNYRTNLVVLFLLAGFLVSSSGYAAYEQGRVISVAFPTINKDKSTLSIAVNGKKESIPLSIIKHLNPKDGTLEPVRSFDELRIGDSFEAFVGIMQSSGSESQPLTVSDLVLIYADSRNSDAIAEYLHDHQITPIPIRVSINGETTDREYKGLYMDSRHRVIFVPRSAPSTSQKVPTSVAALTKNLGETELQEKALTYVTKYYPFNNDARLPEPRSSSMLKDYTIYTPSDNPAISFILENSGNDLKTAGEILVYENHMKVLRSPTLREMLNFPAEFQHDLAIPLKDRMFNLQNQKAFAGAKTLQAEFRKDYQNYFIGEDGFLLRSHFVSGIKQIYRPAVLGIEVGATSWTVKPRPVKQAENPKPQPSTDKARKKKLPPTLIVQVQPEIAQKPGIRSYRVLPLDQKGAGPATIPIKLKQINGKNGKTRYVTENPSKMAHDLGMSEEDASTLEFYPITIPDGSVSCYPIDEADADKLETITDENSQRIGVLSNTTGIDTIQVDTQTGRLIPNRLGTNPNVNPPIKIEGRVPEFPPVKPPQSVANPLPSTQLPELPIIQIATLKSDKSGMNLHQVLRTGEKTPKTAGSLSSVSLQKVAPKYNPTDVFYMPINPVELRKQLQTTNTFAHSLKFYPVQFPNGRIGYFPLTQAEREKLSPKDSGGGWIYPVPQSFAGSFYTPTGEGQDQFPSQQISPATNTGSITPPLNGGNLTTTGQTVYFLPNKEMDKDGGKLLAFDVLQFSQMNPDAIPRGAVLVELNQVRGSDGQMVWMIKDPKTTGAKLGIDPASLGNIRFYPVKIGGEPLTLANTCYFPFSPANIQKLTELKRYSTGPDGIRIYSLDSMPRFARVYARPKFQSAPSNSPGLTSGEFGVAALLRQDLVTLQKIPGQGTAFRVVPNRPTLPEAVIINQAGAFQGVPSYTIKNPEVAAKLLSSRFSANDLNGRFYPVQGLDGRVGLSLITPADFSRYGLLQLQDGTRMFSAPTVPSDQPGFQLNNITPDFTAAPIMGADGEIPGVSGPLFGNQMTLKLMPSNGTNQEHLFSIVNPSSGANANPTGSSVTLQRISNPGQFPVYRIVSKMPEPFERRYLAQTIREAKVSPVRVGDRIIMTPITTQMLKDGKMARMTDGSQVLDVNSIPQNQLQIPLSLAAPQVSPFSQAVIQNQPNTNKPNYPTLRLPTGDYVAFFLNNGQLALVPIRSKSIQNAWQSGNYFVTPSGDIIFTPRIPDLRQFNQAFSSYSIPASEKPLLRVENMPVHGSGLTPELQNHLQSAQIYYVRPDTGQIVAIQRNSKQGKELLQNGYYVVTPSGRQIYIDRPKTGHEAPNFFKPRAISSSYGHNPIPVHFPNYGTVMIPSTHSFFKDVKPSERYPLSTGGFVYTGHSDIQAKYPALFSQNEQAPITNQPSTAVQSIAVPSLVNFSNGYQLNTPFNAAQLGSQRSQLISISGTPAIPTYSFLGGPTSFNPINATLVQFPNGEILRVDRNSPQFQRNLNQMRPLDDGQYLSRAPASLFHTPQQQLWNGNAVLQPTSSPPTNWALVQFPDGQRFYVNKGTPFFKAQAAFLKQSPTSHGSANFYHGLSQNYYPAAVIHAQAGQNQQNGNTLIGQGNITPQQLWQQPTSGSGSNGSNTLAQSSGQWANGPHWGSIGRQHQNSNKSPWTPIGAEPNLSETGTQSGMVSTGTPTQWSNNTSYWQPIGRQTGSATNSLNNQSGVSTNVSNRNSLQAPFSNPTIWGPINNKPGFQQNGSTGVNQNTAAIWSTTNQGFGSGGFTNGSGSSAPAPNADVWSNINGSPRPRTGSGPSHVSGTPVGVSGTGGNGSMSWEPNRSGFDSTGGLNSARDQNLVQNNSIWGTHNSNWKPSSGSAQNNSEQGKPDASVWTNRPGGSATNLTNPVPPFNDQTDTNPANVWSNSGGTGSAVQNAAPRTQKDDFDWIRDRQTAGFGSASGGPSHVSQTPLGTIVANQPGSGSVSSNSSSSAQSTDWAQAQSVNKNGAVGWTKPSSATQNVSVSKNDRSFKNEATHSDNVWINSNSNTQAAYQIAAQNAHIQSAGTTNTIGNTWNGSNAQVAMPGSVATKHISPVAANSGMGIAIQVPGQAQVVAERQANGFSRSENIVQSAGMANSIVSNSSNQSLQRGTTGISETSQASQSIITVAGDAAQSSSVSPVMTVHSVSQAQNGQNFATTISDGGAVASVSNSSQTASVTTAANSQIISHSSSTTGGLASNSATSASRTISVVHSSGSSGGVYQTAVSPNFHSITAAGPSNTVYDTAVGSNVVGLGRDAQVTRPVEHTVTTYPSTTESVETIQALGKTGEQNRSSGEQVVGINGPSSPNRHIASKESVTSISNGTTGSSSINSNEFTAPLGGSGSKSSTGNSNEEVAAVSSSGSAHNQTGTPHEEVSSLGRNIASRTAGGAATESVEAVGSAQSGRSNGGPGAVSEQISTLAKAGNTSTNSSNSFESVDSVNHGQHQQASNTSHSEEHVTTFGASREKPSSSNSFEQTNELLSKKPGESPHGTKQETIETIRNSSSPSDASKTNSEGIRAEGSSKAGVPTSQPSESISGIHSGHKPGSSAGGEESSQAGKTTSQPTTSHEEISSVDQEEWQRHLAKTYGSDVHEIDLSLRNSNTSKSFSSKKEIVRPIGGKSGNDTISVSQRGTANFNDSKKSVRVVMNGAGDVVALSVSSSDPKAIESLRKLSGGTSQQSQTQIRVDRQQVGPEVWDQLLQSTLGDEDRRYLNELQRSSPVGASSQPAIEGILRDVDRSNSRPNNCSK